MLSLLNIQKPAFQTASGYCTTSQDFLDMVNRVIPELLNRGDWPGTIMPIRACVRNGCVTWPRYVQQIRKMNHCRSTIKMRNVFYEFLDYNNGGRGMYEWQGWCGNERQSVNQFRAPVYNDIVGPATTIRVIPDVQADIGVGVQFFGADSNGQTLRTQTSPNVWVDGITVTAQLPFGSSNTFISRIDRVIKPVTQGNLRLYGYDSTQNAMYDMAVYEPSETNPAYLRQQLSGGNHNPFGQTSCNQQCLETVIALVKLKFIPVVTPSDGLIFLDGAEGALLDAFRAAKREDAEDFTGAKTWWASAINKLNRQLEDFSPDDVMAVQNNVFAGRRFTNRAF